MDIAQKINIIIGNFTKLKKLSGVIQEIANLCIETINNEGKLLFCGNGGSAANSQHFAAELVVRYKKTRKGIPAISLTTDTSVLTAIGNDLGAEKIFERQVETLGNNGDVLIALTTSGNSENVINAVIQGKKQGLKTVAITGASGGKIKNFADISLLIPSDITNNIQEMELAIGHILCEIIEDSVCD